MTSPSERNCRRRWAACAALLFALAAQPADAQTIDTIALRARTRVLSSDLLEGRGTGTRGEHLAALYIASELMRMGAAPVIGNDFLLPVPLKQAIIDNSATAISYAGATYQSVRDFVWNAGGRGALSDFAGPLTYVGVADSIAVNRAGELRGRIAVMNGAMGAAAISFVPSLLRAGAAGVVLLAADQATYDLYVRSRGDARYFVDAAVGDPVWQADLPVIIAGPEMSRTLMRNTAPVRFSPIAGTMVARFKASIADVKSANVAGVIRGADPARAHEYVAFSAHYDHLGISTPQLAAGPNQNEPVRDSIYNGFSDNAAGVAMLLGIGDVLSRERPARSILLLFFTGEERGLLGSSYYASHPPLPLAQMKALINLDAGAPPAPPTGWRIAGGSDTPFGEIARTALAAASWDAQLGIATPNSDYWPFLTRGVPAIFLIPGSSWEGVDATQQATLRARWDRYHQAGDEWHADFPFSGLARYAQAALMIGRAVAQ